MNLLQHLNPKVFLVASALFFCAITQSIAQGEKSTIQFSGIVVDGDNSYGVPGVHVYIKRAGLGTVTNGVGFFSLPTLSGDTVTISAVGYKKQNIIIPERKDAGFTVLIDLQTDTTYLPVVEVFPYASPEIFKEAFLALDIRDERYENMEKNLNQQTLNEMARSLPMDGSLNHRYFMYNQIDRGANRFFAPSFSILNPFAWAEFIKSVKRGDLKKKN
ncbi:carboxypeptidase-like regulatory domain-containing protein [Rapidithrix thailandica]|uniref:Carboxypeptidase-like regulatory domain-containing protein n=1 Tax=Rapidithrix thailandica TaxID=413964 RepID=A0AAW9RUZ0_9BACT